jgi:polyisoprenoid-binding protein YceI
MKRRSRLIPTTIVAIAGISLSAAASLSSIGNADVQFLALGPAGMKINGTSSDLSAAESDGKLTLSAPLTNLKTGIGLRDKHLKGYLHTDNHPTAKLVVDKSKLKTPTDGQTAEGSATGDFTLNGKTKPLKFKYKVKRTGSDFHVQGMADVNIKDYAIEQPCYLGVCVDPNVKLKVAFKLRDK